MLVNNAAPLPDEAGAGIAIGNYDFAVVQIPLRAIYHDTLLTGLDYSSIEMHEKAFKEACERLAFHLQCRMEWNAKYGLLTFVANFMVPQRNPMGVLFAKFDLRNPEYFIGQLNQYLEELVRSYSNAYILDIDRICASIGRRHLQDDLIAHFAHGALTGVGGALSNRIEPVAPIDNHFDMRHFRLFLDSLWAELIGMFRVVRQTDAVKLVVVDLDDTLWTGISGEIADVGAGMLEGWPLGLCEALNYLKKRGILLAIVSKNEESRIRDIWPRIFGTRLSLSDFAAVIINWAPKSENMQELLHGVNLLPRNVLFIDDNPAERAAMSHVFPQMRVIGRHPYYLRSTLLWSTETQVPSISKESSRRTEMVQAQLLREGERQQLSREDFLRAAAPQVVVTLIRDAEHDRFPRAFELLNKTNQYNTTGRRWTREELIGRLRAGAVLHTFEVDDAYTSYGLVGVVIVSDCGIDQWVMSCRILGYDVEKAVMSELVDVMRRRGAGRIFGSLLETEVNFPCRDLFEKCGFAKDGDLWVLEDCAAVQPPQHVKIMRQSELSL